MAAAQPLSELGFVGRLNFLLTNRVPRRWLTQVMGRFSKIRNPLIYRLSMSVWRAFVDDLRLHEAKKQCFDSMHDCFIRELKNDARPIDTRPDVITSPVDAVIGEFGQVNDMRAFQAKGFPYSIVDLLGNEKRARRYRDGRFITLRLKSSMYHRFHAPCDAKISFVDYFSGDTWNVNPVALKTVEALFCKNERAVLDLEIDGGSITLVPVAAILVASMRFRGIETQLNLNYNGPTRIPLNRVYAKGDEIGYFQHGSTVVMFTSTEFEFASTVKFGDIIRMGRPLMRQFRNILKS